MTKRGSIRGLSVQNEEKKPSRRRSPDSVGNGQDTCITMYLARSRPLDSSSSLI